MRVLIANLRLFYQCPRLWLVYLFWGFFLCNCLRLVQLGDDAFTVLVILALPAAWIVTAIQENVAAKPFCLCLPGHRGGVRRLVLLIGAILSIAGGLYFALNCRSSDASPEAFVLIVCSGLCFTWSTYLIGIALAMAIGSGTTMSICLMSVLVVTGGFGLQWRLDCAILSHPVPIILLGAGTGAIVWRWLSRPCWFRRSRGRPADGLLFGPVGPSERARQLAASAKFLEFPPVLDRWLLGIIRTAERPASVKGIAGATYTTLMPLLPLFLKWRTGVHWVLFLLTMLLVAGYASAHSLAFIGMLLVIGVNGLDEGSPLFSEMLIQGGRRERFYVTIVLVAILAVVSAGILTLLILALNLLSPWFPDVSIRGSTFTFHRISLGLPMLAMIAFPVLGWLGFWSCGRRGGRAVRYAIVFAVQTFLIVRCRHIPVLPVSTLVLVAALAWLVFVYGVYRIAMQRDLVKQ